MADDSKHEARKHKKKQKKKSVKVVEESTVEDATTPFNNNVGEPQLNATLAKVNNIEPKLAPKEKVQQASSHKWTMQEREEFVSTLRTYSSQEEQKQTMYNRVDWKEIKVGDINPNELHEEFKRLIKKVRKVRTVKEIVDDMVQLRKANPNTDKDIREKPPRKPVNSFMLFCKAKRPSLLAKHPELPFPEVHKKLCIKWKEIPEDKKRKYVKKWEKEKRVYAEEMKQYKERQRLLVKKPLTAFEMWKIERMKEGLEEDEGEEVLKEEWEALPMSMKKGWMHAASSDEDRYKIEIKSICNPNEVEKKTTDTNNEVKQENKTSNEDDESESSNSDSEKVNLKRKVNAKSEQKKSPVKKPKKETSSNDSSSDDD